MAENPCAPLPKQHSLILDTATDLQFVIEEYTTTVARVIEVGPLSRSQSIPLAVLAQFLSSGRILILRNGAPEPTVAKPPQVKAGLKLETDPALKPGSTGPTQPDTIAQTSGITRNTKASDESLRERIYDQYRVYNGPCQPQMKMEKPMSKVRIVNVFLFDNTAGLKAEDRLIAKYENITTDGSDTDVIVNLALNHDIKAQLAHHNAKRAKTVNEELLNRVGKKVMLLPIEAKQIEYRIREVASL